MKLFGSALTPEQLEERRKGIGASDAAKVIEGGEAWAALWRDKTSRETPKRIMGEWDAALRHTTEELQCDWYEHIHNKTISLRGVALAWPKWPVLKCTLDGAVLVSNDSGQAEAVFECKHISPYTPNPIEWAKEKYAPQVIHQAIVTGANSGVLSIIVGMAQPVLVNFDIDPFFAEAYVERCREFWGYVERDEPPPGAEPMPVPIPVEDMREVDMTGSNEFGAFAADWLEHKIAAKKFETAAMGLKKLIEPDVRKAFGFGLEVTRAKNQALTVKEKK